MPNAEQANVQTDRATPPRPLLFERVLAGSCELSYGLLGEHLGHSHSPAIHAELGSTPYELVEVPPSDVRALLATRRFKGLNVTIPYKKVAAEACDELSAAARRLGNANTVVVRGDGVLYGDNTDYHGFSRQLASTGVSPAGRVCLVVGDGGAASTVRAVLEDGGASQVVTATRRGTAGTVPLWSLNGRPPVQGERSASDQELREGEALCQRVEIVVNATPAGMYPHADDEPPVDLGRFPRLACVCDLVYNPLATRLVQRARELGVPAAGGLLMLVAQAKRASDLFLGVERPDSVEDEVFSTMTGRLRSISLIGMPGSGKTRAGQALAKIMGFEFVDVDDLIPPVAGMSIREIFSTQGEDAFRAVESACTADALSKPGRVVATGGGVVTRPQNLPVLRQNGPVVLLTRGLDPDDGEELTVEGRPLSQAKGLDRLRLERAPLYRAWADIAVGPHPDGPEGTASRIAAILSDHPWK